MNLKIKYSFTLYIIVRRFASPTHLVHSLFLLQQKVLLLHLRLQIFHKSILLIHKLHVPICQLSMFQISFSQISDQLSNRHRNHLIEGHLHKGLIWVLMVKWNEPIWCRIFQLLFIVLFYFPHLLEMLEFCVFPQHYILLNCLPQVFEDAFLGACDQTVVCFNVIILLHVF